jgi:hypothetical protein
MHNKDLWVLGWGWDETIWPVAAFPTAVLSISFFVEKRISSFTNRAILTVTPYSEADRLLYDAGTGMRSGFLRLPST